MADKKIPHSEQKGRRTGGTNPTSSKKLSKQSSATLLSEKDLSQYLKNVKPEDTLIDDPDHIAYGVARAQPSKSEINFGFEAHSDVSSPDDEEPEMPDIVEILVNHVDRYIEMYSSSPEEREKLLRETFNRLGLSQIVETPLKLPSEVPGGETYAQRSNRKETAPEFIGRVYKQWLTGDFTRADLRKLDDQAEMALRNWERVNGRASLNLPSLRERNDRLVAEGRLFTDDPKETMRRAAAATYRRDQSFNAK